MKDIVTEHLAEALRSEQRATTGEKQKLTVELLEVLKEELSHGEFRSCLHLAGWDEVLEEMGVMKTLYETRIAQLEHELKNRKGTLI